MSGPPGVGPGAAVRVAWDRPDLRADCSRCVALCCVAPAFRSSADFATDKEAGVPCRHLLPTLRCGIHAGLRERGYGGCAAYECFGAGQKVSQVIFHGADWRDDEARSGQMFAVFAVVRQLHELLSYLAEAATLPAARPLRDAVRAAAGRVEAITRLSPDALLTVAVQATWQASNDLLRRASRLHRGADGRDDGDRRHVDLVGAQLRGADLRAADLRVARLVGADLAGADLRRADLIGADLRGADLSGADLEGSLFLRQPQADAARGDARTVLPVGVRRPAHWRSGPPGARSGG
jgi:uncharacterized protein YjbI with pentapeptide repeats